jgi:hypothetical protein
MDSDTDTDMDRDIRYCATVFYIIYICMTGGWISTRASGMKKNLYGNIGRVGKLTHLMVIEEWREPLCNQDTRVNTYM